MATKKAKSVRKKQCATKGCRKSRVDGSEYCAEHAHDQDPLEEVSRLTELDRLRFLEADQALVNWTQEIKILDQEQRIENNEHEVRKRVRQNRVDQLRAAINARTIEQRQMLVELGEKYGFDPKISSIDDRTGVIVAHPTDK